MKEILLSQNKKALVDNADFDYLNQWKWYYHKGYATRYPTVAKNKRQRVYMHRIVFANLFTMSFKEYVDHINGNKLDNRRKNLRFADKSQNGANSKLAKDNTSGYKGVTWHKQTRKWQAQIQVKGKNKYLGIFKFRVLAARAYDKAAKKFFGKFAKCNFEV